MKTSVSGFFVAAITHLASLTNTSLKILEKCKNKYSKHCDSLLVISMLEPYLSQFHYDCDAKNIFKENTCFKNALSPSCIDVFLTNNPFNFPNIVAVSNRFPNFHKMVIIVMKMLFKEDCLIERHYRDYKYFDQTRFENNLNETFLIVISNYELFETTFIEVLNKHTPLRKKYLRANHAPYITKTLMKVI